MLKEIKPLLDVPWTLLSAGADFERFAQRLARACEAGCSGFVAGRALWKELASCETEAAREQFIEQVVANRFRALAQIVYSTAHSMWRTISLDLEVPNRWYENYNALSAPSRSQASPPRLQQK
jgi:tagatose 1,6-diphosphate aldolase